MNKIKTITLITIVCVLLLSCNKEASKRKRFSFDEIKTELNLSPEQSKKFDVIITKYTKIREEGFAGAKEGGKMDRSVMMKKMQTIMESQNKEVFAILTPEQLPIYQSFAEKMARRGRSGYSKKEIEKITTQLALDSTQVKMLNAVNKAFEKSYSDAHDFYHGNSKLAKTYWDKYDNERKNALKKVFTEDQNTKYLEFVKALEFKGEHK